MSRAYNFCNNCGNIGHTFNQCRQPITSIGMIAFKRDFDDIRYLLICRKDTLGYVDFMRGKYKILSKEYLKNIFNEMTIIEKNRILESAYGSTSTFDDMWSSLWGDKIGIQYRGEEKTSREKFNMLKNGIHNGDETYNIKDLIKSSTTSWDCPEWGFPKGRRNYRERDLICALREFEEESGISSRGMCVIQNLQPYEETFTGSNYKSYKHSYYVAEAVELIPTETGFQKTEVSQVKWMTYDEAMSSIREYNIEKKDVLTRTNNMLKNYRIC